MVGRAVSVEPNRRADGYLYRHRVADIMSTPLVAVEPSASLADAVRLMRAKGVSSVVVGADGIVTERDVVAAVAQRGGFALDAPVGGFASRPLHGVPADAFVFVALGRMTRLGVRHLVALDDKRRPVGMVTARSLLSARTGNAPALGDGIATATGAADLRAVRDTLPALATALLDDGLDAREVAAVIGTVFRDMTGRAAELGVAALAAGAEGAAPGPWCCLVLGSAGRGESLLGADQDNALIHGGEDGDPWFAALGERIAATLDEAGLPLCRGSIMAARAPWRHTLAGWRALIEDWVARAAGDGLVAVDIFYDFVAAAGDVALADTLRAEALTAARSPLLLTRLAQELHGFMAPIDLLGRLRVEQGRIDLKLNGLHPIVGAARLLALHHGIAATGTADRLRRAFAVGAIPESDLAPIGAAHERFARLILEQQIADIEAGAAPSSKVAIARLSPYAIDVLKDDLRRAATFADGIRDAVQFT